MKYHVFYQDPVDKHCDAEVHLKGSSSYSVSDRINGLDVETKSSDVIWVALAWGGACQRWLINYLQCIIYICVRVGLIYWCFIPLNRPFEFSSSRSFFRFLSHILPSRRLSGWLVLVSPCGWNNSVQRRNVWRQAGRSRRAAGQALRWKTNSVRTKKGKIKTQGQISFSPKSLIYPWGGQANGFKLSIIIIITITVK